MKVLIACEESQRVCSAFRARGHEAYSCDILPPSGGHPECHIQADAIQTMYSDKWDLIIAHPPCTRLCRSGQSWLHTKNEEYNRKKHEEQQEAIKFFMEFVRYAEKTGCKMAIENPIGIMSTLYRKPDQIYNPYDFEGETECKRTCLWLFNGLKPLKHTQALPPKLRTNNGYNAIFNGKQYKWNDPEVARLRSQTPFGVAKAMAEQWG